MYLGKLLRIYVTNSINHIMVNTDLHTRILTAKKLLNEKLVKLKTSSDSTPISYRELNERLDLIHEVERIGLRNLSDRDLRKLNRMLAMVEVSEYSSN